MVIMECIKILPVYHHFCTRNMIHGVVGGWLDPPNIWTHQSNYLGIWMDSPILSRIRRPVSCPTPPLPLQADRVVLHLAVSNKSRREGGGGVKVGLRHISSVRHVKNYSYTVHVRTYVCTHFTVHGQSRIRLLCKRSTKFQVHSWFSCEVFCTFATHVRGWKTMRRYTGFARTTFIRAGYRRTRSIIFIGNVARILRLMMGSCTIVVTVGSQTCQVNGCWQWNQ